MFTKDYIIDKLYNSTMTQVELPFEEACMIQKILINHGYAVLMTAGDFEDKYKIEWLWAGDGENLDYADSNNIIFADKEYLEMLLYGDYIDEQED